VTAPPSAPLDRAAAIRAALRRLVAERGFHGTSMSAVATEAEVAAGTTYVHYRSKDELVVAAYLEVRHDLGRAAASAPVDARPDESFRALWLAVYDHLVANRADARFLQQVDASPYAEAAQARAAAEADDAFAEALARRSIGNNLVALPRRILGDLAFGLAVRLAASGASVPRDTLVRVADACWRAVSSASG